MRGYIILEKLTAPYTVYSSLPEIVWGAFFQSPTRNIHVSLSCNYFTKITDWKQSDQFRTIYPHLCIKDKERRVIIISIVVENYFIGRNFLR